MTDTENITLSKILVLDLLRRAAPGAYLAEREELLRTIVELRRELSECKAALLRVPFPFSIDEMSRRSNPKAHLKRRKRNV